MKRFIKITGYALGIVISVFYIFKVTVEQAIVNNISMETLFKKIFLYRDFSKTGDNIPEVALMAFTSFVIFTFLFEYSFILKSSTQYRSLILYRYGKKKYIKICIEECFKASTLTLFIILLALACTMLSCSNKNTFYVDNNIEVLNIVIILLKIVILIFITGMLNILSAIKGKDAMALALSLFILVLMIIIDLNIKEIGILTYSDIETSVYSFIILIIIAIGFRNYLYYKINKINLL